MLSILSQHGHIDLLQNNYGLLSLEISNVSRDDQGLYSIKAANVEGEIACSAPLDVEGNKSYIAVPPPAFNRDIPTAE